MKQCFDVIVVLALCVFSLLIGYMLGRAQGEMKCEEKAIASVQHEGKLSCVYENPKWGVAKKKESQNVGK